MDPIDWQWATHPRLIFLRSQCFMSELPPCRGAMNNKRLGPLVVDVVYYPMYTVVSLSE